jgi:hypothetical protein
MKKILVLIGIIALLASASQAKMVFGVDQGMGGVLGQVNGLGGLPYIGFMLNENQRVDVSLQYSDAGSSENAIILAGRFENRIMTVNQLILSWGAMLGITAANPGSTTTINLAGIMSAEHKVTENLGIYGSIYLLGYSTTSPGGANRFVILDGNVTSYSGIRIYI